MPLASHADLNATSLGHARERLFVLRTRALEHADGIAQQRLLLFRYLRRVNLIPLRNLVDRLLLSQRLQRYLAYEL